MYPPLRQWNHSLNLVGFSGTPRIVSIILTIADHDLFTYSQEIVFDEMSFESNNNNDTLGRCLFPGNAFLPWLLRRPCMHLANSTAWLWRLPRDCKHPRVRFFPPVAGIPSVTTQQPPHDISSQRLPQSSLLGERPIECYARGFSLMRVFSKR